ncbi:MAG: hypothetical protein RI903_1316, partial [Bacteroidota bacterium]
MQDKIKIEAIFVSRNQIMKILMSGKGNPKKSKYIFVTGGVT